MTQTGQGGEVYITGIGPVTPVGVGVDAFWSSLVGGRSGVTRITSFPCDDLPSRIAGVVPGFDAAQWIGPEAADRLDRFGLLAAVAAALAFADAGIPAAGSNGAVRAVALGSTAAGLRFAVEQNERYLGRGLEKLDPVLGPLQFGGGWAGEIASRFGCRGPLLVCSGSLETGIRAIDEAARWIRRGDADVALAGGVDATVFPLALAAFARMNALSTRNEEPDRACRPFDRFRDGMVLAEGACLVVLESGDHLRHRGGAAFARIAGAGSARRSDDGSASVEAMHAALGGAIDSAGWTPDGIDYLAAQGTSTIDGDRNEVAAFTRLLGPRLANVPASAASSMLGHAQGAAGALSTAVAALAIRDGVIPPTINCDAPDSECAIDCVRTHARRRVVARAVAHGYGFAGVAAALALETPPDDLRLPPGPLVPPPAPDPEES